MNIVDDEPVVIKKKKKNDRRERKKFLANLGSIITWTPEQSDYIPTQRNFNNLSGNVYGSLTVLHPSPTDKFKTITTTGKVHMTWQCECACMHSSCRGVVHIAGRHLKHSSTQSCGAGCLYNGVNNLSLSAFNSYKIKAIERNIPFEITIEYAERLYQEQNGACALSGEPIKLYPEYRKLNTASLDRIDSDKSIGYIEGNVQWVYKKLNVSKWDMSDNEYIAYSARITKHQMKKHGCSTVEELMELCRQHKC